MGQKVLIFEADANFATELRNHLAGIGMLPTVVDDGNAGLQHAAAERPDLILLSIELPRMNGFSVCNKLKKDPSLKDVPLIIMSSDSSDETFEQHKKLRTRAEDYVHKPITFGDLLERIRPFVDIGGDPQAGADEGLVVGPMSEPPATAENQATDAANGEDDLDAAFARVTNSSRPEPAPVSARGSNRAAPLSNRAAPVSNRAAPMSNRAPAPTHAPLDGATMETHAVSNDELNQLRSSLQAAEQRTTSLEQELSEARSQISKLGVAQAVEPHPDVERLQREVDELKQKMSVSIKPGAVSSREFLDLREALNKKDKEILSLKEGLSKKDKEIVEAKDKVLLLERASGEVDDKMLAAEREMADLRDKIDSAVQDKDQAKKAGDDFKARLQRTQADLEAKNAEIKSLGEKHTNESAARDAQIASMKADHVQALDAAEARRSTELDAARQEHESALAAEKSAHEQALAAAHEKAIQDSKAAVTKREGELKSEADAKLAALHRAHQDEVGKLRAEHEKRVAALGEEKDTALAEAAAAKEAALAEASTQKDAALAEATAQHQSALAAREAELVQQHETKLDALRKDQDETLAALEAERTSDKEATDAKFAALTQELEGLKATLAATEANVADQEQKLAVAAAELAATKAQFDEARTELTAESARAQRAAAKWEADKGSLEKAKDALAVVLAQIEETETRPIA